MRNVTVTVGGVELTLHYSMDVLFDVNEKFGSLDGALNAMQEPGREGFEALLWMARRLAKEGELLRRERGEPARDLPASAELSGMMQPLEAGELLEKVSEAVALGYQREIVKKEQEVDLGLLELEKKEGAGA